MTRLTSEILARGPSDLGTYDQQLRAVTGSGLLDLAMKTTELTVDQFEERASALRCVSIIPMTVGQGIIPGFAKRIAKIGRHLGLTCEVTEAQDVAGLGEALAGNSEVLMCADDDAFLALHLVSKRVIDNGRATGEIYAAALVETCPMDKGQALGVLGVGPVGLAATAWLESGGYQVIVHDQNRQRQADLLAAYPNVRGAGSISEMLAQTHCILDATNAADIIKVNQLEHRLILAAPGVPLGVDDPNSPMISLIHDPLELGVTAMFVQVLS